jgi:hypothetical protein
VASARRNPSNADRIWAANATMREVPDESSKATVEIAMNAGTITSCAIWKSRMAHSNGDAAPSSDESQRAQPNLSQPNLLASRKTNINLEGRGGPATGACCVAYGINLMEDRNSRPGLGLMMAAALFGPVLVIFMIWTLLAGDWRLALITVLIVTAVETLAALLMVGHGEKIATVGLAIAAIVLASILATICGVFRVAAYPSSATDSL